MNTTNTNPVIAVELVRVTDGNVAVIKRWPVTDDASFTKACRAAHRKGDALDTAYGAVRHATRFVRG